MSSTRLTCHINAPRTAVYRALIDARAVEHWMVPTGMTSRVHTFDPREGGLIRISLTYEEPSASGKSSAHTDTYHGRFVRLIPDQLVVEVMEFETADPAMRGEMTVTFSLSDTDGGTQLRADHDNLPPHGRRGRRQEAPGTTPGAWRLCAGYGPQERVLLAEQAIAPRGVSPPESE